MTFAAAPGGWSGRAVAITGATGFVGHHVAMLLTRCGAQLTAVVRSRSRRGRLLAAGVRCLEAPLKDPAALARAFAGCEYVFHLAGAVDFENDWERFQRVNVEGSRSVLAAARAAGVRRVIHTSSIVAVGASARPAPLDETARWNLGRLRVPYVTTKRQAEELALAAADGRLEVVVVNPASVIGPDDFAGSAFGSLCRRFWRGRLPLHFGGGNNYVDVRDVAAGHLLAAERGRSGQRYLLGGTNRTTTAFFADLAHAAGRPIFRLRLPDALGPVVADLQERFGRGRPTRAVFTPQQARLMPWFFYYDSSKAQKELGYRSRLLPTALADTYAFWIGRRSA
jgi:dihydroflavonol-4-reductase